MRVEGTVYGGGCWFLYNRVRASEDTAGDGGRTSFGCGGHEGDGCCKVRSCSGPAHVLAPMGILTKSRQPWLSSTDVAGTIKSAR